MHVPDRPVRTIMSSPARTIDGQATAREAAEILSAEGIGSLVVDATGARGILTRSHIVEPVGDGVDPREVAVADLMASPAVTIAPDDGIQAAVDRMADSGSRRLVVSDGSDALGILTTTDLVEELATDPDASIGTFVGGYGDDRPHTYECRSCGSRAEADQRQEICPGCGGRMRNISVPRE